MTMATSSATITIVNLTTTWSDGDLSRQPNPSDGFQSAPPNLYLEKVGQMWMEQRNEAVRGNELPVEYTVRVLYFNVLLGKY